MRNMHAKALHEDRRYQGKAYKAKHRDLEENLLEEEAHEGIAEYYGNKAKRSGRID